MTQRIMLCDCAGTQKIDAKAIGAATGLPCSRVFTGLCTHQMEHVEQALQTGEELIIACQQEAPTFTELAADLDMPEPTFTDIRDRAGWSDDASDAAPKMAALLAASLSPAPLVRSRDVTSHGTCLILGAPETAVGAAQELADTLAVTCLLDAETTVLPGITRGYDVILGRLGSATGSLGGFRITIDGLRQAQPGGRGALAFSAPKDGGKAECDIILDLTGNPPLFPAHEKRDGYLRADPGRPASVAAAMREASQMVGTYEKPLFIRFDETLCAHSRASQTACTRCLDLCPTGAITPDGDTVSIDPMICAGCGACASACPSGAASYDDPPVSHIYSQLRLLSETYRKAGGKAPRLLVHDDTHGREMIALAARLGRGLPAQVIPFQTTALAGFGHAEVMVALASGFSGVDMLLSPKSDLDAINGQAELANALTDGLGHGPRLRLLDPVDPDALSDLLYADKPKPLTVTPILPLGGRREATRLAARALAPAGLAAVPLPAGAPYGSVTLDQDSCTLCLSCASLCPSGALLDNPDSPELSFKEDACIQCGLCENICPEDAITLDPRLDLSDSALDRRVLKEEEPYPCIECGKLFGVKSTVERIVAKLEGAHPMFIGSDNARLIRMCDDCRINAQYHSEAQPFRMGDRPRVRTTDDYLAERKKDN